MTLPAFSVSSIKFFTRSSNSPRYLVPATREPTSSDTTRLLARVETTSLLATAIATASAMAVFPTPGSPTNTGLFLVRRLRTCMMRRNSFLRPITGSNCPLRACSVRSLVSESKVGVALCGRLLPRFDGLLLFSLLRLRTGGRWPIER